MDETSPCSVTRWIAQLRQGDEQAANKLWERYFASLVRMARGKLGGLPRRASDEEDVALSVLGSVFAGAKRGAFSKLSDRNDLWLLFIAITRQKVANLARREFRKKRGGGLVHDQQHIRPRGIPGWIAEISDIMDREPTPDFAVQLDEEIAQLLGLLDSDSQRRAAIMRMEGYSSDSYR